MTDQPTIYLTAPTRLQASEDDSGEGRARELRGTAVEWGVDAHVSTGQLVRFERGSVDLTDQPVVLHHDETQPIGVVYAQDATDTGVDVAIELADTQPATDTVKLAKLGALTGLSVGVNPTEFDLEDSDAGQVMVVRASQARHLAVVTNPALSSARVTDVAAAQPTPNGEDSTVTDTPKVDAAPTPAPTPDPAPVAAPSPDPAPATVKAEARMPSLGQFLYAALHRDTDPQTFAAMRTTVQAAAAAADVEAAATASTDVGGIIPVPIFGDVVGVGPSNRPLCDAFGPLAGPTGGASFTRPVISSHLEDAATIAESGDASGTALDVDDLTVPWEYVKRSAPLSAEAVAFTSPSVLGVVASDLVRAYMRGTEAKVAAKFRGNVDGTNPFPDGAASLAADGSDAIGKLFTEAATIFSAVGEHPDTLVCAPDIWAKIGGWVASDGRALFPTINPQNASGTGGGVTAFGLNPLNLNVVVSWALTAGDCFMVASSYVETYEAHRVQMNTPQASTLSQELAVGGAVATIGTNVSAGVHLTIL